LEIKIENKINRKNNYNLFLDMCLKLREEVLTRNEILIVSQTLNITFLFLKIAFSVHKFQT
jgi:hypothetical protein